MKILLFLNGPEGCQMGIEDGFLNLKKTKKIEDLLWFYYHDHFKENNSRNTQIKMLEIAESYQPQLIVIFHIDNFPVDKNFFLLFKNMKSKPIIVYDEGDMYGGWSKPITGSMRLAFLYSDIISIRGLGKWYNFITKLNNTVIYTPHSNSLFRQSKNIELVKERNKDLLFIGNRVLSKFGNIRRLHGANKREGIVKFLSRQLNSELALYGNGWDNLSSNKGKLAFNLQIDVCKNHWFHLSYEHYPEIPYYFSDRLPIALSSGQIYICHFHEGYQNMFSNTDFIYFYKTEQEANDLYNYLKTLNNEQLFQKSMNAKRWADENLSPLVVWNNFFEKIIIYRKK